MENLLRLMLALILLTIGLAAYFLVLGAFFSQRVAKARTVIQSMPGRAFGIGLVNFIFFAVIAFVLFSLADHADAFIKGVLTIPAVLITAALAILLTFGLSAVSSVLGERLFTNVVQWKQTAWGTICLTFACAVPFVGWFLLLPYVGFLGVGAYLLSFFQREPRT